jgi:hypothetical protein
MQQLPKEIVIIICFIPIFSMSYINGRQCQFLSTGRWLVDSPCKINVLMDELFGLDKTDETISKTGVLGVAIGLCNHNPFSLVLA